MSAKSILYKLDVFYKHGKLKINLRPFQEFLTVGGHGWEFAETQGRAYLIMPNYYQCGSTRGKSCESTAIYAFDFEKRLFVEHARLLTSGPASVTSFKVDGQLLVAVGENFDDKVAIFQEKDGNFSLHQKLSVIGAGVSAIVQPSPASLYLVAASYHDHATAWRTRSVVFRWDFAARRFDRLQELDTFGAHHVEAFRAPLSPPTASAAQGGEADDGAGGGGGGGGGEQHFIFVANDRDDRSPRVHSAVYRLCPRRGRFVRRQRIPTHGAHGAATLATRRCGATLLAVANFGDRLGGNHRAASAVLAWSAAAGRFRPAREVPTVGATDWEAFAAAGEDFLAVSNEGEGGRPHRSAIFHVRETCPGDPAPAADRTGAGWAGAREDL
jgi:hypothetical protein